MTGGGDDTTNPYQGSYTWTNTTTATGTQTVTSYNGAGTTATTAFTVTKDATAPTGGSVSVPAYSSTLGGITITTTNYTDASSGIASNVITRSNAQAPTSPGVCPASGYTGSTTVTSPDTAPTTGQCYLYTLTGTDNVNNTASVASSPILVDTTTPSTPTIAFSGLSANNTYDNGSGTLYFRPSAAGTFTVTATSSDAQSGIKTGNAGYTFGNLNSNGGANFGTAQTGDHIAVTFDATTTGPTTLRTASSTNNTNLNSADATYTITQDSTAPTGGSVSVPAYSSTLGGITITTTNYTDASSGIASNVITRSNAQAPTSPGVCPASGYTGSTTVTSPDTAPTTGQCYLYTLTGTDNVNNTASVASSPILVDTTAPSAPALTVSESSPLSYVSGTTLFYNAQGSNTAGFTVDGTSSDAQSGIQKLNFPTVTGMTGGGDDTTNPYQGSYTWTNTTTASGAQTVTSYNGAGTTATTAFTVTKDATAPTGQSAALSGGPWYTTLSVPLTIGWGSDAGSGLDVSTETVQRDTATLTNGTCGTFPGTWTTATLTGGADTTVTSGNCYRYRATVTDNVGNQTTTANTADAKVDSSAPGAPALTLSESSPLSYVSGTTLYYNAQGSNTAGFTVDGTSTDAQSGIQKLTFPTVTGMTGGGDDTTNPYQGSYTWTNTTTASGAQTVTPYNGAGTTATTAFTVTKDATAPTGQSAALSGGPWYTTLSVPLTIGWGSDAGSGLDVSTETVQRDTATLTNGTCGTFPGTWTTVTLTGGADTTVTSGNCYRYRATVTDNVGNQTTTANTADAKVDTSAPASRPPHPQR